MTTIGTGGEPYIPTVIGTGRDQPQRGTLVIISLPFGSAVGASVTGGIKSWALTPGAGRILSIEIAAEGTTGTASAKLVNGTQSVDHCAATTVPNAGATRVTTITNPNVAKGDLLKASATTAGSSSITGGIIRVTMVITGPVDNG